MAMRPRYSLSASPRVGALSWAVTQLKGVFPVLFCHESLLGFPGLILDVGCCLAFAWHHGMGPAALPAQGLWGPAPMVSSLLVLFLPLSHPPQWRALPLLSPGIFPQRDQGKGRADGGPFWCNLRPERKVLGAPAYSVSVTRFPDPYTAGLCPP